MGKMFALRCERGIVQIFISTAGRRYYAIAIFVGITHYRYK
jgi:hypothetical protein